MESNQRILLQSSRSLSQNRLKRNAGWGKHRNLELPLRLGPVILSFPILRIAIRHQRHGNDADLNKWVWRAETAVNVLSFIPILYQK
jgi:hypothetical protein